MVKEECGSRVAQPIREWVESNVRRLVPETAFSPDEIAHLTMCMEHLYKHYYEGYPVGGFLRAVAENHLYEAVLRADDVNWRALRLYVLFLANEVPFAFVVARRISAERLQEVRDDNRNA